ncbi:MAG: hypothetical protein SGI97_01745 [candidate division Zixibacteria bacterium]|nr:hypothetical protein [candidate division Zixibacteria bacterium]
MTVYIEPGLKEYLERFGGVNIDYVSRGSTTGGYHVSVGSGPSNKSKSGDCE